MNQNQCQQAHDEWAEAASHISRYARQIRRDADEIKSEYQRLTVSSLKTDLLKHRLPNMNGAFKQYRALIDKYRPAAYKAVRECKAALSSDQMQALRDYITRVDEDLKLVKAAVDAANRLK